MSQGHRRQLHMVWAGSSLPDPSPMLDEDYALCPAGADQVPAYRALMAVAGFGEWDDERIAGTQAKLVTDGWQVVIHKPTGTLVASGMALHSSIDGLYAEGYEVGWIAADPQHSGHKLGRIVTAAATARMVDLGGDFIFLRTDDFRLPALKSYLSLGFVPDLVAEDMAERWQEVCAQLGWAFTPDRWPASGPYPS